VLGWPWRLDALAPAGAVRLIQEPMGEVQVDGRQCDDLVGRVRRGASQGPVATPTRGGSQMRGGGRAQPSLVYARVADLSGDKKAMECL
jgi:hypothetical protein